MIRRMTILLTAGALAAGTAACDWRAFDDLADETWVHTSTRPDGMDSDDYLVGLAWAGGTGAAGAEILVAGDAPAAIGTVSFDASGGSFTGSGRRVSDAIPLNSTVNFSSAPPPIVGSPAPIDGKNLVAVGMPEEEPEGAVNQSGVVILHSIGEQFTPAAKLGPLLTTNALGAAVAFANTDHDPSGSSNTDVLATAGNSIVIFPDVLVGATAFPGVKCAISPLKESARAIIAADVTSDSAGQEVLVTGGDVAIPGNNPASILVLAGSLIDTAANAGDGGRCFDDTAVPPRAPMVEITAPGGETDFGATLVTGDFNGNGKIDLAASAPNASKVYVFLDLDFDLGSPSVPTPEEVDVPGRPVAMSAGDLGGDGRDELIIGDPTAAPDTTNSAGSAYLYAFEGGSFVQKATLHDIEPEQDQQFGRAVLIAPFGSGGEHVLAIASAGELFTYFQTPISADVR